MKNILITGGAGFIGSNLALYLVGKGYNVRVLDNLSDQIHGKDSLKNSPLFQSVKGKVEFIYGSVENEADWAKALTNQDAVIHYAAETGTGQSMYDIKNYVNVNVNGTALMLDMLVKGKHSVKKVIVASSRAIYGEGKHHCKTHGAVYPDSREFHHTQKGEFDCKCPVCGEKVTPLPTDEESIIKPVSIYGITKNTQESLVHNACKIAGISSFALRYQNVYGPGQSLKNPYTGILSIFSNLILNNEHINIFEDGKESRDFVFIDDVVDATTRALEYDEKIVNSSYNVGTGIQTTVLEVVDALLSNYTSESTYQISGNYRFGDIRHNYADLTKVMQDLNFEPKTMFSEGIEKFCQWVLTQKIEESKYKKSLNELKTKGLLK